MSSNKKATGTKEDAKLALVPKLRFPEFGDTEWVKKRLEAVAPLQRGFDLPSDLIRPGNVPIVYSNGIQKFHEVGMATAPGLVTGRSGTIGKLHFIEKGEYWPHNTSLWVTDFKGNVPLFVYYLYDSIGLGRFSSGSGVPTLNRNDVHAFISPIPRSPAEQQKIAECLSSVDEMIAVQARKVDALKTHKKGLMQQLFPREGETQPCLRFPEFQNDGEWKGDTLGSVCELYQPVTLSSSELSMTGEYLVYGANGVIGSHNEYNHEESEIAVTCRGATCGEVTTTQPKSWITGNAMVVRPRTKKLRKDFIFHYLKNHGLKTVISGSAQPQITRTGFAPLVVFFPEHAEQQGIASCLSSLDALLTPETQKLEALKRHKLGLLQQLFPSSEGLNAP